MLISAGKRVTSRGVWKKHLIKRGGGVRVWILNGMALNSYDLPAS